MAEKDSTSKPRTPLKMVGGADCPSFYVNVGAVVATPFDIQMLLGEVMESDGETVTGRAAVRVIMTPEHAFLLNRALSARLKDYTEDQGSLRKVASEAAGKRPGKAVV